MCNVISDAYSLIFTDGKDLVKGNYTKIPEVAIEANRVLCALGNANSSLGKGIKNGYDCFVKDGHAKATKFWQMDINPVSLVMGLVNCHNQKSDNKLKTYTSYLAGFGAKYATECLMDTSKGSKIIKKVTNGISDFAVGSNKKVATACSFVLAGVIFPMISDKAAELTERFTNKLFDKYQSKTGKV